MEKSNKQICLMQATSSFIKQLFDSGIPESELIIIEKYLIEELKL